MYTPDHDVIVSANVSSEASRLQEQLCTPKQEHQQPNDENVISCCNLNTDYVYCALPNLLLPRDLNGVNHVRDVIMISARNSEGRACIAACNNQGQPHWPAY